MLVNSAHFPYTDKILTNTCIKKLKSILEDNSHPLHTDLQFSARSGRLIYLKTNREQYKNSFMPLRVKNKINTVVTHVLFEYLYCYTVMIMLFTVLFCFKDDLTNEVHFGCQHSRHVYPHVYFYI